MNGAMYVHVDVEVQVTKFQNVDKIDPSWQPLILQSLHI
jgi:hypothetical protein